MPSWDCSLRGPALTLDLDAWNVGTSLVTLLLVAALASYGFTVALQVVLHLAAMAG
jgi:hypothetical protein